MMYFEKNCAGTGCGSEEWVRGGQSGCCLRGQPDSCPGLLSVSVMKHCDEKQPGEERVYSVYLSTSVRERLGQEPKQEQRQELWQSAAYWLAPSALLRWLSYASRHHLPRAGPAHSGLSPPTSLINWKKMLHILSHRPI